MSERTDIGQQMARNAEQLAAEREAAARQQQRQQAAHFIGAELMAVTVY